MLNLIRDFRHHWIAVAVFIVSGTVFHQPDADPIHTGIVAAMCAGLYLLVARWLTVHDG